MSYPERAECATTALTQLNGHSHRCANPFCAGPVKIKSARGKHGRYCSSPCRMDGYALRRAKALLDCVGIIRFQTLLDKLAGQVMSDSFGTGTQQPTSACRPKCRSDLTRSGFRSPSNETAVPLEAERASVQIVNADEQDKHVEVCSKDRDQTQEP